MGHCWEGVQMRQALGAHLWCMISFGLDVSQRACMVKTDQWLANSSHAVAGYVVSVTDMTGQTDRQTDRDEETEGNQATGAKTCRHTDGGSDTVNDIDPWISRLYSLVHTFMLHIFSQLLIAVPQWLHNNRCSVATVHRCVCQPISVSLSFAPIAINTYYVTGHAISPVASLSPPLHCLALISSSHAICSIHWNIQSFPQLPPHMPSAELPEISAFIWVVTHAARQVGKVSKGTCKAKSTPERLTGPAFSSSVVPLGPVNWLIG